MQATRIASQRPSGQNARRVSAVLGFLLLLLVGLAFRETLAGMVRVWNTENYQHGYLIAPMAAWLAWRNRERLVDVALAPFWPAVLPLAGACALWSLGRLAGVNAAEQFALLVMTPGVIALVFGWRLVRVLAYPLAFLMFAVPFGESLYPIMMERTADFTVAAVRLSGVPVIREGLYFELPTGRWSVVEACSGLRYLLAALPLAALYAALSWHSWVLRTLFIAMTAIVAIVANWLRAYLIVMLGHFSGMRLAVGVDHLIYGWVFFGVVMAIVFWLGSRWQERKSAPGSLPRPARRAQDSAPSVQAIAGCVAVVLIGAIVSGTARLQDQGIASVNVRALAPEILPETDSDPYRPNYTGGVARVSGRVSRDPDVGLLVAQYVRQHRHGEMITYENGVNPGRADAGQHWRITSHEQLEPASRESAFPHGTVNEYRISGPHGAYLVWEWFWVNGRTIADPRQVKIYTAMDLLRGRGDESLAWVIWTPVMNSRDEARARLAGALDGFQGPARAAGMP